MAARLDVLDGIEDEMMHLEHANHCGNNRIGVIVERRLKHFLPDKLKLILVQTLVMPHFDYCDIILSNLNANLSSRLQRVHNACVRYICNIRVDSLHILSFENDDDDDGDDDDDDDDDYEEDPEGDNGGSPLFRRILARMVKCKRKTSNSWTENDVQKAVKAFREGRSLRHAAELLGVPHSCLQRRQPLEKYIEGKIVTRFALNTDAIYHYPEGLPYTLKAKNVLNTCFRWRLVNKKFPRYKNCLSDRRRRFSFDNLREYIVVYCDAGNCINDDED
ncbi:hypothetical protein ANN_23866 [Periplaneta americana]|uniref:HTH psq-type domain-containing protein n=1 Tax=Periplaneta americana TaxID=6978 RepID=A0ABQ8S1Q2_PERAM|nr:hypothetical protein ANN_23866 [Periplaneta americana]